MKQIVKFWAYGAFVATCVAGWMCTPSNQPADDNNRDELARRCLAAGHRVESRYRTARDVIARSLSVRETESLVKKVGDGGDAATASAPANPGDVHTRAAEDQLKVQLGTRVRIVRKGKGGRIEIDFTSEQELIRLFETLTENE